MAGPILPTRNPSSRARSPKDGWRNRSKSLLTRRYARVLLLGLVVLSVIALFFHSDTIKESLPFPISPMSNMPPIYEQYHEYERNLPQHDLSLPPPDGKHAKFIYFANHAHGALPVLMRHVPLIGL